MRVGVPLAAIVLPLFSACSTGGEPQPPPISMCVDRSDRCEGPVHVHCGGAGEPAVATDCALRDERCVPGLGCALCIPETATCLGADPARCSSDGRSLEPIGTCDVASGEACRDGACSNLCMQAEIERSYEGCEFYPVDLDAGVDGSIDTSRQQYAVVASNPTPLPATVVVEQNDAAVGEPPIPREIARATLPPGEVFVFELPRREVDGSSADGMNDGTHTAITPNAYRLRSTVPIVAYQFNPLERGTMYTADASLLLPSSSADRRFTVLGWPQTIGPEVGVETPGAGTVGRSFVSIVGTEASTEVSVTLGPRVIQLVGGSGIPPSAPGDTVRFTLGPFEVANLESLFVGSDFTGTVVDASAPVLVYSGSEMANVPFFEDHSYLRAADHLEEQLLPDAATGREYVLAPMPSRSRAVAAAMTNPGAAGVAPTDEGDWFRVLAVSDGVHVTTSLPAPDDSFDLDAGEFREMYVDTEAMLTASGPVSVMQFVGGQESVAVPRIDLPGGDPASCLVPPIEQWRSTYAFLTPPRYAFDFAMIVADAGARVELDGMSVADQCDASPMEASGKVVYRCELSFPTIREREDAAYYEVESGLQQDGAHRVEADRGVGLVVYGFDVYISYAYPGGLRTVSLR